MNVAQTGKVWQQWQRLAESAPARYKRYGETDRTQLDYASAGEAALVALAKVAWNTALAEALTPVLQAVEISLRNWMDHAIINYLHQLKQPYPDDWLRHAPYWLHPNDRDLAQQAETKLQEQVDQGKRTGFNHNDMVATSSFALWSNMVRNNSVWSALSMHKQGLLIKGYADRHALHKALDDIRNLRNRSYHLEPIFAQTNLPGIYGSALGLLQILDPRLHQIISCIDRFALVYDGGNGWQAYRDKLYEHYGLGDLMG